MQLTCVFKVRTTRGFWFETKICLPFRTLALQSAKASLLSLLVKCDKLLLLLLFELVLVLLVEADKLLEPEIVEIAWAACEDKREEADETEDKEMEESEDEFGEQWPVVEERNVLMSLSDVLGWETEVEERIDLEVAAKPIESGSNELDESEVLQDEPTEACEAATMAELALALNWLRVFKVKLDVELLTEFRPDKPEVDVPLLWWCEDFWVRRSCLRNLARRFWNQTW